MTGKIRRCRDRTTAERFFKEIAPNRHPPAPRPKFKNIATKLEIDVLDLAVATEALRDCEDALALGAKSRALEYVQETRAILDSWREQLS